MTVNNEFSVVTEILSPYIETMHACITSGFEKAMVLILDHAVFHT